MACGCKDFNGKPTDRCVGLCKESLIMQQDIQARDPLNGFSELILSQVDKMIESKINKIKVEFQKEQIELHKIAFLEGLKEGIEIGKTMRDY